MERDRGFVLAEMIVTIALTLIVVGAAFALVNPSEATSVVQPEAMDMQQRVRAAALVLSQELSMAGAGPDAGSNAGPLVNSFAPVIPRRIGMRNPDPDMAARRDAVTITYVLSTYAQSTTSVPVPDAGGLAVNLAPNCPIGDPLCGFGAGMTVAVFDPTGHFDLFSITSTTSSTAELAAHGGGPGYVFAAGADVAEVRSHTFYYDALNRQLRDYDGFETDTPVVDNVVGLSFDYFGDPHPPLRPKPPVGVGNCLYDAAGNPNPLPTFSADWGELASLPLSMLSDGPWCGGSGTLFDVDLLRVRAIRVTLRIQATAAGLRGTGLGFARPGQSHDSSRYLPDLQATFLIAPQNLNHGW